MKELKELKSKLETNLKKENEKNIQNSNEKETPKKEYQPKLKTINLEGLVIEYDEEDDY